MTAADLFVGTIAIALGLGGLIAAVGNWDRLYRFAKVRWIESMGGRPAARIAYGLLGAALIALGVAIALGFGPNRSRPVPPAVPLSKSHSPSGNADGLRI